MTYRAKFKAILPEFCPVCGCEEYAVDGFYRDRESAFEAETVNCFECSREMGNDFIIRHAVVISEKAEPFESIRQDYLDHIREMEHER